MGKTDQVIDVRTVATQLCETFDRWRGAGYQDVHASADGKVRIDRGRLYEIGNEKAFMIRCLEFSNKLTRQACEEAVAAITRKQIRGLTACVEKHANGYYMVVVRLVG